jgi:hypothetical protein
MLILPQKLSRRFGDQHAVRRVREGVNEHRNIEVSQP